MSGLDKILSKIITDASAGADSIINEANSRSAVILQEAAEEAAREGVQRIAAASLEAQSDVERSRSAARLEAKRILLKERNRIIDEAVSGVKDRIYSLPDEDYFMVLQNFILSHLQNETGVIVLNHRDLARIPAGFLESLCASAPAPLTISETPGNFDAGCVLIYGEVEYNGTLTAIINEKKDELRDLLNRELFAEVK